MGSAYSVVIDGKDYTPNVTNGSIRLDSNSALGGTLDLVEPVEVMTVCTKSPRKEIASSLEEITNIIDKRSVATVESSEEDLMPELESNDTEYQGATVLMPHDDRVVQIPFFVGQNEDYVNVTVGNTLIQHDPEHAEVMRKAALRFEELRQKNAEERVQEVAKKHAEARVKELEERWGDVKPHYPVLNIDEELTEEQRVAQQQVIDNQRAEERRRVDLENIARNEELRLLELQYNGNNDDTEVLLQAIRESRQENEFMFGLSEEEALRLAILESEELLEDVQEITLETPNQQQTLIEGVTWNRTPSAEDIREFQLAIAECEAQVRDEVIRETTPIVTQITAQEVTPKVTKFVAWI